MQGLCVEVKEISSVTVQGAAEETQEIRVMYRFRAMLDDVRTCVRGGTVKVLASHGGVCHLLRERKTAMAMMPELRLAPKG